MTKILQNQHYREQMGWSLYTTVYRTKKVYLGSDRLNQKTKENP